MGFIPRTLPVTNVPTLKFVILVLSVFVRCIAQGGNDQPKIRSIIIDGNHVFTDLQILNLMSIRISSQYSEAQLSIDLQRIYDSYAQHGYYFADVRLDSFIVSSDLTSGDVRIKVNEGDQVVIDSIECIGNTSIPSTTLLGMFDTRTGHYLKPSVLENDLNTVLSKYEQCGYPFSKVIVKEIAPVTVNGKTRLRILIQIDEGKNVTIDEIKIIGNTITKDAVIVREIRLKLHENFDENKILKMSQRLHRLNIFSRVESPQPYITDAGGGILIKVEEGNTSTFDGIIGYAPGVKTTDRGVVTGMVNVSMRNLFGTARKANVHWLRDERKSQEISLGYTEPWVLNFPLDLGISFNQRQQDTTYVKRTFGLKPDLLLTESLTLGGMFGQEYVISSKTVHTIASSRTMSAGVSIRYDTRDDLISPMNGVLYYTDYQIGRKTIAGQTTTAQRLTFDAGVFVETFKYQVAVITFHARSLSGSSIDLSDLYRLGGTNTLRGYRENQFLGSRVAWTNSEYRLIIARRSFVFGFFDTGYYYRSSNNGVGLSAGNKFMCGYGIGFRVDTSLGNIGVSFAFGEGDTFTQGKVHVGLTNEF